ncbi:MAG: undecaprenyl-diphosphate phosphatase [Planctomycetes bacterium]|nr:undecaprenyl-diphosphate phosphatase [Planctomycetota bacterium]
MTITESIILGIVQGITEFLPVSSSGHLVVLQKYMGLDSAGDEMILFDLAVHVGTVVAVLIYYRHSIAKYLLHLKNSLTSQRSPAELYSRSPSVRISICAISAIAVTGIFYALAGDWIEQGFESSTTVGICWLITATLLIVTDQRKHTGRGLRQFGIAAAVAIGLAQGMALWPGISRSGTTICIAVLLGLRRRWAVEFSFLIGIPAILAAALIKGTQAFQNGPSAIDWAPILVATVVSAAVGLVALGLLIWAVKKAKLKYFAIYLYLIGTLTLIFSLP